MRGIFLASWGPVVSQEGLRHTVGTASGLVTRRSCLSSFGNMLSYPSSKPQCGRSPSVRCSGLACYVYWQLPSVSRDRVYYPRLEDTPCPSDRGPIQYGSWDRPWIGPLVSSHMSRRPGFNPRPIHVIFVFRVFLFSLSVSLHQSSMLIHSSVINAIRPYQFAASPASAHCTDLDATDLDARCSRECVSGPNKIWNLSDLGSKWNLNHSVIDGLSNSLTKLGTLKTAVNRL